MKAEDEGPPSDAKPTTAIPKRSRRESDVIIPMTAFGAGSQTQSSAC
jgi:hypothetical protein